jgi:predicted TIM-barrel fold metal-dependent hydrolase
MPNPRRIPTTGPPGRPPRAEGEGRPPGTRPGPRERHSLRHVFCTTALFVWKLDPTDVSRMATRNRCPGVPAPPGLPCSQNRPRSPAPTSLIVTPPALKSPDRLYSLLSTGTARERTLPVIVDAHAHLTAPPELYAHRVVLQASRGWHGSADPKVSDERLRASGEDCIALMDSVGTDVQFISPRPYTLGHSDESPAVTRLWVQANNDTIARQVAMFPHRLRGVAALPQSPQTSPASWMDELERCVTQHGFIGALLNPDPAEGLGGLPALGDPYWYPVFEKLVELDVPALIHSAACRNDRETYTGHFITEETTGILSLLDSDVFDRFPQLRLIIAHGGGSVPYQIGRWRALEWRHDKTSMGFDVKLTKLWFDTVLYNAESLELLFKIVGSARCLFATEKPGTGSTRYPGTNVWMDDVRPLIEAMDFLTDHDKEAIFHGNAATVFPKAKV